METKNNFWWLKSPANVQDKEGNSLVPKLDLNSTSIVDLLDDKNSNFDSDVDVGSIIEEINRVAAQSPLGPFERSVSGRSVDDLIKEAEKIYHESSKSFDQLSQKSKTSQNLSDLLSNLSRDSTPTPKSVSPLPMDPDPHKSSVSDDDYTEDFSEESRIESANISPTNTKFKPLELEVINYKENTKIIKFDNKENIGILGTDNKKNMETLKLDNKEDSYIIKEPSENDNLSSDLHNQKILSLSKSQSLNTISDPNIKKKVVKSQSEMTNLGKNVFSLNTPVQNCEEQYNEYEEKLYKYNEDVETKQHLIETLEKTNDVLKLELQDIKMELKKTQLSMEQAKLGLVSKKSSPEINQELERAKEDLKDSKEKNTSLQLQLDTVNKSHQLLKTSFDDLLHSNKNLERRLIELDCSLDKYKNEILTLQQLKDKLIENEANLNKLLEIEKLQSKSIKLQNEKDAKCIQDLNRQIKEMERIVARKHPDSVSALIVAAKENATDTNLTARKILENRIKSLEQEQQTRESQSSKVFVEIQEKFNQMKLKYENHIEDLELHVKDLKNQLKRKGDTYDVYTQTHIDDKIPQKETFTTFTQTDPAPVLLPTPTPPPSKPQKSLATKKNEDSYLIATIRGLQTDLTNKEKVINRLQKEIDDLKKTNRRLQKEREGSLKNLIDKKEFKSFPDKLSLQARSNSCSSEKDFGKEERILNITSERDKLKSKLNKLQDEYQSLQSKRIQDLTSLQQAHEEEVANYIASISPLREQLEINQLSVSSLQSQLTSAEEELAIVRVERDHLSNRLNLPSGTANVGDSKVEGTSLLQKIGYLEKQYVDREYRLRTMIQNLAQKSFGNRSCEQCSERQQQLITYKAELDQLMPSVQALQ